MAGKHEIRSAHVAKAIDGPLDLDNLHFIGCSVGTRVRKVEDRFTISGVNISRSKANLAHVGPVRIEECTIESTAGTTAITSWATLFDRCVVRGRFGRVQLYDFHTVNEPIESGSNASFRQENDRCYRDIDWALDISDAKFSDLDIRSIPGELIRVNGEDQVVLSYDRCEAALADGKLNDSNHGDRLVPIALEQGDLTRYNFAMATHSRQKYYREVLEFFSKARKLGLIVS